MGERCSRALERPLDRGWMEPQKFGNNLAEVDDSRNSEIQQGSGWGPLVELRESRGPWYFRPENRVADPRPVRLRGDELAGWAVPDLVPPGRRVELPGL